MPRRKDPGPTAPAYEEWRKDDLLHRARIMGVEVRARMTKAELIKALRQH